MGNHGRRGLKSTDSKAFESRGEKGLGGRQSAGQITKEQNFPQDSGSTASQSRGGKISNHESVTVCRVM